MLLMFVAPLFLLASVALPAPLSRLAGVVFLATMVGLTWRAAMIGSIDLMLLMGGATLARRFGFPRPIAAVRARRIAMAGMVFVFVEFGLFALLVANYTGTAIEALPFDFGFLLSGLALALFLSRGRERNPSAKSPWIASPQALPTCA